MGALTRRQRLHDRARTYNILQIGVGIYEGLVPRQGGKNPKSYYYQKAPCQKVISSVSREGPNLQIS